MQKITGGYHGMSYAIRYVESEFTGAYYSIRLTIGDKHSLEMASTLIGAFIRLAERIRAWDLEEKEILMTPEQAQKRIGEWKAAWNLLKSLPADDREGEQAELAIFTILQASIDLGEAGYRTNEDETDWYHPSDGN